jgi:hypothetical protein
VQVRFLIIFLAAVGTVGLMAPLGASAAALGVSADASLTTGSTVGNASAATALHLTWVRVDVAWAVVAPTQPKSARLPTSSGYVWTSVDSQLAAAASLGAGTQVLLSVSGTPNWARADGGAGGSDGDPAWMPKRASWQNFVAALVARYNGTFAAIEIWPQPNLQSALRPQRLAGRLVGPGLLKVLTNLATLEIRKVSATVAIISGGLARTDPASTTDTPPVSFLRSMSRTRMRFDAVGMRLVPPTGSEGPSDPTNFSVTDSAAIVAAIDTYWPGSQKGVWLTGYGVPSGPAASGLSSATQSVGITSFLSAAANPRIGLAVWNSLANTATAPYGGILLAPTVDPFVAPSTGTDPAWDTWTTILPVPVPPPV